MSSVTLDTRAYPVADTIEAYPLSNWPTRDGLRPSGAPVGSALANGPWTVAADGTVTVQGLSPGIDYLAYALVGSDHRYVRFAAKGVLQGRLDVTTAGTPERLVDTSVFAASVTIESATDNTGPVAIGSDNTVDVTEATRNTIHLDDGETQDFENVDLRDLWIDVSTNGDAVSYNGVLPVTGK